MSSVLLECTCAAICGKPLDCIYAMNRLKCPKIQYSMDMCDLMCPPVEDDYDRTEEDTTEYQESN